MAEPLGRRVTPPLVTTFGTALTGLAHTYRHERSFRIQTALFAGALVLSLWVGAGTLVVLAFGALVLALELVNTALERLCDAVHPQHHPMVGAAKDAAAAAVLVASAAALVAGFATLLPPLLARLSGGS